MPRILEAPNKHHFKISNEVTQVSEWTQFQFYEGIPWGLSPSHWMERPFWMMWWCHKNHWVKTRVVWTIKLIKRLLFFFLFIVLLFFSFFFFSSHFPPSPPSPSPLSSISVPPHYFSALPSFYHPLLPSSLILPFLLLIFLNLLLLIFLLFLLHNFPPSPSHRSEGFSLLLPQFPRKEDSPFSIFQFVLITLFVRYPLCMEH